VPGLWRKLHNEDHSLYSFPSIVKNDQVEKDEMGEACSTNGGKESIGVIGEKAKGKGPLGRPRHRWVINIKMNVGEIVL
jgi:hypothetical protein